MPLELKNIGKKIPQNSQIQEFSSLDPGLEFPWEIPVALGIFWDIWDPAETEPSQQFWDLGISIRNWGSFPSF